MDVKHGPQVKTIMLCEICEKGKVEARYMDQKLINGLRESSTKN
jgi:hypothetical protein